MEFIERHERSPRAWYGGAVGIVGFDGSMNTGLTLRTIRVKDGTAQVRVGATLLWDSDPDAEEEETALKASAFLDAIRHPSDPAAKAEASVLTAAPRDILLVDHRDSFVHTLANYLRRTGSSVRTLRSGFDLAELRESDADLVVLSPGPGRPSDFELSKTIGAALDAGKPVFGVCLGLQGIVEHFGGTLGTLRTPMHGKPSTVRVSDPGRMLGGLGPELTAGRYHSLYAEIDELPDCLRVTATSDDGVIMAIEHTELPVAAVQFHPESIMSLDDDMGMSLIANVVANLR
jgi:anthranilate synthase